MLIDRNNIPADRNSEIKCMVALKGQFEAMAAKISTGEIVSLEGCQEYVWLVINEATEILEG